MVREIKQTSLKEKIGDVKETTTIRIGVDFKKRLDDIKIHPRETYEDIIERLMKEAKHER